MSELQKIAGSPVLLTPQEAEMLQPDNITVSIKNGVRRVEGFNHNGERVVIETIVYSTEQVSNGGYRQKNMSVCEPLAPEERKRVAAKLRSEGYTQTEIAKRLGVSQKTISNDLRGV